MKHLFIVLLISFYSVSGIFAQNKIEISTKKINEHGINFYLHTVKKGETLYRISKAYNVEINDILYFNPELFNGIKEGQVIKIPEIREDSKYYYHLVKKGETIYSICKKYSITTNKLYAVNNNLKEEGLKEGTIIKIPKNSFTTEPKEFEKNIDEKNVIYHTVQPKESLYSISRKYNVSIDEILELNPFLKDQGLRKYETIKIPKKQLDNKQQISNENKQKGKIYIEHFVKKGETLYGISKTYGISQEEIIKYNPNIKTEGLLVGEILKIPEKGTETTTDKQIQEKLITHQDTTTPITPIDTLWSYIDSSLSPICDTSKINQKDIKILVSLPFNKIQVINDPQKDYSNVKNFETYPLLEFYEGLLFSMDSLKKKGINIKVIAIDINDTLENKQKITTTKPNLIYMYGTPKQEMSMVSYAKAMNIPVIDIFRSDLKPSFKKYIKLVADKIEKYNAIIKLVNKLDTANFIFLYKQTDSSAIKFLNKLNKTIRNNPNQILKTGNLNEKEIKNISDYMTTIGHNYIIMWSFDEPQVTKYINKLAIITTKHKIKNLHLIELPEWKNYKHDYENLHILQTLTIRQNYTPYDSLYIKHLMLRYKEIYGNIPTKFALWGFDIGYYFTNAVALFGHNFINCLNQYDPKLIETRFNFEKSDFIYNTNFFVILLTNKYDRIKIFDL